MQTATPFPARALSPRTDSVLARLAHLSGTIARRLESLAPVADLAVRVLVASVFFKSGLTKIASWGTTVSLFENEYAVPLLDPQTAALLGTGIELAFPVLLALGLGSRFAAFVLFLFNIVAVVSYPDLGDVGLKDHQLWGVLLLIALLHGPGRLSLDHLLRARFGRKA